MIIRSILLSGGAVAGGQIIGEYTVEVSGGLRAKAIEAYVTVGRAFEIPTYKVVMEEGSGTGSEEQTMKRAARPAYSHNPLTGTYGPTMSDTVPVQRGRKRIHIPAKSGYVIPGRKVVTNQEGSGS